MKSFLVLFLSVTLAFASEADLKEFASSSRLFTESVYNEVLVDNKDNILVSPFSVETVLALTQSGAIGTTGQEIRTTLYLPETQTETESLIKTVLPALKNDLYVLKTANKIYVEDGLAIKDDFKKVATDVYQAAFESIEFSNSEAAAEEINHWVEQQTEDKIHDLVDPDELDATTRVVLVNALYFQGNWTTPFIPQFTKKATFFAPNDKTVDVDALYQKSGRYNYYESEELDAKFLELPFRAKDQKASFTIVLPNKPEGIAVLERQMKSVFATPEYLSEFVEVTLPKFKIESTIDFEQILQTLGVRAAFDPDLADFSGIAGEKGELFIGKVLQKTFIDVNEIGVEAAAVTEVGVPTNVPQPATRVFNADHPFVFYIKVDDIILFEGRVLEPSY